jgi:membrane protein
MAVVKRFGDHGDGALAGTIAYYGFFSLFPLLMALTSIAAIVLANDPDLQDRILDSAVSQFPVIGTQIRENVGAVDGSGVTIAVGIALALWAGIGGVRAAQVAMDTVWDVPRKQRSGMPIAIARAMLMLVVLGTFLLAGVVLSGIATGFAGAWGTVIGLGASALLHVAVFVLAYRVLTVASVSWNQVAPGAVLAGLGWTVLLAVGGWIVSDRLESSSDVYGTFAVVIGLLAWIYLGAQLTLVGAELNAVLARHLWPRSLTGDDITEADIRALERSARQEERREDEIVNVRFDDKEDTTAQGRQAASGQRSKGKRSIGALVTSVIDGVKQLVRHEVELAKIEATEALSTKAKGAGLLTGAGVVALYALGFLAAAGAAGLAIVLPLWASLLIVGGVFAVLGAILFAVGRRELKAPAGVARTQETLKEDVRWAKQQIGK